MGAGQCEQYVCTHWALSPLCALFTDSTRSLFTHSDAKPWVLVLPLGTVEGSTSRAHWHIRVVPWAAAVAPRCPPEGTSIRTGVVIIWYGRMAGLGDLASVS